MENPIKEILSDKDWQTLSSRKLIDLKAVRDYQIRREYQMLRDTQVSANTAIDKLETKYPDLKRDTIKKIIYFKTLNLNSCLKILQ